MAAPPRPLIVLLLLMTLGCRGEVAHLDQEAKMAYAVKPAVVRISDFATAQFRYSPAVIATIESALKHDGFDVTAQRIVDGGDLFVPTGAGGSGSGFIINPDGLILTSGHVVAPTQNNDALDRELLRNGAISALLKHFPVDDLRKLHRTDALERYIAALAGQSRLEKRVVTNEVELSNGEKMPFTIERFSPELAQHGTDLALLRVNHKNLPVLMLGDSDSTRVGESIWSVGYPAVASSTDDVIGGWLSSDSDLEATFNPGIITAIKRNVANTPVFQSNVAIYRGNSGGPAVNRAGEAIGISTWGRMDAESIKFLVPINVARGFLTEARVQVNVEGEFDRHYRASLEAAQDGKWTVASTELASANNLFPSSPDLIRFRHDTDRALQSMPLWRKHPVATASAGGALAALVLALTIPRVRRPRIHADMLKVTTERVISPASAPAGTPLMLGKFTILNGPRAGERLGLGGSGIRLGRESAMCEIVLENPKVSRLHAEVVSIDGKVLLIDRNSSNGTYVNDQKIDKRFLKDGDIIYFGGRNAVAVAFHA
ncbi:MAG TPA: trypsin-like peptidase domain-containing protein [Thermoanaerobaculia bacterium]|jgi:serine protease Do|nr:trypsin-like peptidase domain-containing protein [Thermoanaerobaculia bacterium]